MAKCRVKQPVHGCGVIEIEGNRAGNYVAMSNHERVNVLCCDAHENRVPCRDNVSSVAYDVRA